MTIVRWNPFNAMDVHQERMSRMFEAFYGRPQEDLAGSWVPAVDIYSNGQHELVLRAELPDMLEEEIDLTLEDNTLTRSVARGSSTRKSRRRSFIASSAVTARSRGRLRCRRRSTLARSAPSTRPAC